MIKRNIKYQNNIVIILLIILFIYPNASSKGYSLFNYKLNKSINYVPHNNFGSQTITDFNEALAKWNYELGTTLMKRDYALRHSDSTYPKSDGINRIYRISTGYGNYIAQNTVRHSNGSVIESDINFNMYYPFSNGAVSNHFDVYSIFLHETGHTLGINHSEYSDAVMYAHSYRGVLKRNLHFDDVRAVSVIYK